MAGMAAAIVKHHYQVTEGGNCGADADADPHGELAGKVRA
jgi:hypothetical protein